MTTHRGPRHGAAKERAHRRPSRPPSGKGGARELYEGRDVGSDPPAIASPPDVTPPPASRTRESAPEYAGEFEQRTPGARGTGPAGEIGSRGRLLESLRERIASDPEFAGCDIDLELDAQGVRLGGTVSGARQRARLKHLVEAAGVGRIDDRLSVGAGSRETRAGLSR